MLRRTTKIKKRQLFTSNLISISPWLRILGISVIVAVWDFGWSFLTKGTHGIHVEQTSREAVEVRKLLRRGSFCFGEGSGRFFDLFGIRWIEKKIWNPPGKQQNVGGWTGGWHARPLRRLKLWASWRMRPEDEVVVVVGSAGYLVWVVWHRKKTLVQNAKE